MQEYYLMSTAKKSFAIVTFFLVFATGSLTAQDAVSKAIASANTNLTLKEYSKALPYVTFIIRFYAGKDMTVEALDMCERVIAAYSADLRQAEKYDDLVALEQTISQAPSSVRAKAAESIAYAKKQIEEKKLAALKAEEDQKKVEAEQRRVAEIENAIQLEKQKEAEQEAQREAERKAYEIKAAELQAASDKLAAQQKADLNKMADQQKADLDKLIKETRDAETAKENARTQERIASEQLQSDLEKQRLDSAAKYQEQLAKILDATNKSDEQAFQTVTRTSNTVVIGLGILGLIVLAGITLIVIMNMKQQAIQHAQFQSTISTMTSMRSAQQDFSSMALPFMAQAVQALPSAQPQVQLLEQKTGGAPADSPAKMNTPEELKALYDRCMVYAEQIDQVTNRKNASKRVGELVYKISKAIGYSEHDSLLYYTVGLIYDIGFLNIDPVILRSDHISEEQFEIIKTHTSIGMNMVFFIEEKNRSVFKDGVSKHHENIDGTGYPQGLKDGEIPYIARVLRIAETYIALVSSRDYKDIKDSDSALKELRDHDNHYDAEIVKVLEGIV